MNRIIKKIFIFFGIIIFLFFIGTSATIAENIAPGQIIPKLPKTDNDPKLTEGRVYPFWGPVCQKYTYSVIYQDDKNRTPEYVKIYFNGKMLDMEKEKSSDKNYKKGVKYIYKNIPNKFGSNFYYFEASNGVGKTRDSIIDSPDNGPVLFDSDFKNNEIALIDPVSGEKIWSYPTGEEWVGGIALSDDGKYLAAQTSYHIYFFDTAKKDPLWSYENKMNSIGGDVKGGVAISSDGKNIFAALNGKALYFINNSNKPIWEYSLEPHSGGAYDVDISKDGNYAAVAMAGEESNENSNVLILLNKKGEKLWQYHSSGNWHEVSLSNDGSYIAGSTGCPDRRGYIFSKNSQEPIVKTDPLSAESPIDEAQISQDGSVAVFGIESAYGGIAFLNRESNTPLWKFDTPDKKSVRALSITPDGKYIGVGTFGGDVYIFSHQSPTPENSWKLNSSIGAFDISDDASFVAAGGTDKKVHIFNKNQKDQSAEIQLNEYISELDISVNAKYIAAGTSGSVYFFETISNIDESKTFSCDKIIEPKTETTNTANNKTQDQDSSTRQTKLPEMIFGFGFLASIAAIIVYIIITRYKHIPKNKTVIYILVFSLTIFALLTTTAMIYNKPTEKSSTKQGVDSSNKTDNLICGNNLCEPDKGEDKINCPKDCTE